MMPQATTEEISILVELWSEQGYPALLRGPDASALARRYGVILNSTKYPVTLWSLAEYIWPRLPVSETSS